MIAQAQISGIKSRVTIVAIALMFTFTAIAQPQMEKPVALEKQKDPDAIELRVFVQKAENDLDGTILLGYQYAHDLIRIPEHMKKLEYGNFLSILYMNDYTAFRNNNVIKVIPIKEARSSNVPVVEPNGKYYNDEFVTEYINLQKLCSSKILPVLRPLVPRESHLASFPSRVIIISDTYGNIQRLKKVIASIENNADKKMDCRRTDEEEKKSKS